YKLTLKKEYFKDTNIVVSVDLNSVPSKFLDYTTNPNMLGTLQISTDPLGVSIIINDSLTNLRTPTKINKLLPGLYNIRLKLTGYWDGFQQIAITSQRDSYINYRMKDTSLWVPFTTANSGIPTNELTSLAVDNNGIKWMGTWGLGLISFDEKEWKLFDISNSSICSNYINKIVLAPDNSLWIGTDMGMSIFNGTSWTTYNTSNSPLPNNEVLSFGFDNFGRSYIGTGSGLAIIENNVWTIYNSSNSPLRASKITSIGISTANNEVWLASYTGGVARIFNKKTWTAWTSNPNVVIYQNTVSKYLLTNYVQAVAVNQSGDVWVSMNTSAGFIYVVPKIGGNGNPKNTLGDVQAGGAGIFVRSSEKWSL
ncbi:MAG: PEGA domain-containing protein, partial [Ignavibacteriaceae bacterium]|nr:PEGA domain-containing protein [Ignavibacteriaceae bacterium]